MRITDDTLRSLLRKPGYKVESQLGHAASYPAVAGRLPDPEPQSNAGEESLVADANEEGSSPRIVVCITRCGTRLLDKDNLYGGAKPICDALRYQKLIPEDDPESIHLIVQQRKVKRADVGTIIEIRNIT